MNFFTIINLMIAFLVAYIMFMLMRWFVLPNIRIFPYIYPQFLWVSLYNLLVNACTQIFAYIIMFILIMYVIWLIVRLFVPNFPIPMKSIILRLPPLYQMQKAGIFGLIDSVRKILVSNDTLVRRFARAGQGISTFLIKGSGFLKGSLAEIGVPVPSTTTEKPKPFLDDRKSVFSKEQEAKANDEITQCIEENSVPIYPEMTSFEKAKFTFTNSNAGIICKAKSLSSLSNMLSERL